ncbi:RraA family protein [Bradyrhizobium sp. U531]|uniref:RraA family protein n=1 Tax=Bradyrhizobium sp. U531 TaxID=3053458 RepID=UPI003F428467
MIEPQQNPCAPSADPALIEAFKTVATSIISDNLGRLPGATGLTPFHRGGPMAGTAVTVRTAAGDNLSIHKALDLIRPGDVLVVDGGGDVSRALIGEIMLLIATSRNAAGLVIDGAIRDTGAIAKSDLPVFARAANHRGPYKNGPGHINVPVCVGGLAVAPGDVVIGDEDGVVSFPQAIAADLLGMVRRQEKREAEIMQSIREGRYTGVYGKPQAG